MRGQISPFAGGVIFTNDLSGSFPLSNDINVEGQTLNNSVAFGASAGVRFGSLAVEATLAYAPTTMVNLTAIDLGSLEIAVFNDQKILIATADVLFYIPQTSPFVEFFVIGGAGLKRYGTADPFEGWEAGEADVTFDVGAGLEFAVSPSMSARLALRDYISTFDPDGPDFDGLDTQLQNDILWSAGLTFRLGAN